MRVRLYRQLDPGAQDGAPDVGGRGELYRGGAADPAARRVGRALRARPWRAPHDQWHPGDPRPSPTTPALTLTLSLPLPLAGVDVHRAVEDGRGVPRTPRARLGDSSLLIRGLPLRATHLLTHNHVNQARVIRGL